MDLIDTSLFTLFFSYIEPYLIIISRVQPENFLNETANQILFLVATYPSKCQSQEGKLALVQKTSFLQLRECKVRHRSLVSLSFMKLFFSE